MKKIKGLLILPLLLALSCSQDPILSEVVKIRHYPSASGIEYFNNRFYVIGDDATQLLVLDSNLRAIDSIPLYAFNVNRLPKETKADLEAAGIINFNNQSMLFLAGSGSLPTRNTAWLIDPLTRQKDSIRLDTFYNLLESKGLDEINIEGVCSTPGKIIMSNRGNKSWPHNFLVTTDQFWENQSRATATLIRVGANTDNAAFKGVSGLAYASRSDRLILTVSTEDTWNSVEDGAIGKSYLWIINNFSSKFRWEGINPNKIIDLEATDKRFRGQKIESVCVTKENKDFLYLVLAADNDDGSSTFFKMIIKK
jgi:hypothetical protein